jgi:hypothetical protein
MRSLRIQHRGVRQQLLRIRQQLLRLLTQHQFLCENTRTRLPSIRSLYLLLCALTNTYFNRFSVRTSSSSSAPSDLAKD